MEGITAWPVAKGTEHTSADKLAVLFTKLDKQAKQGISRKGGKVPIIQGAFKLSAKDAIRAQAKASKVRTTGLPSSSPSPAAVDPQEQGSQGSAAGPS